jgi:hypothetical protein
LALTTARGEYVDQAQRSVDVLPKTEYGGMIRDGIARLAARLDATASTSR